MKTLLVTGGAGFIGSHLCEALLQQGNRVLNIDSFNDFYDPEIKRRNVADTRAWMAEQGISKENYVLHEGDIRDVAFVDRVFGQGSVDVIVHLAAYAGVRPSIEQPALYTDVNVNGTVNMLEMSRKYGVQRFIFASSSSVYGNNKKVPFAEDDPVDHPISPYAATKKAGELLCHTYHHLYGINIACLRFFTVFGPRQRPDLAIHKFAKLIAAGQPLPFYGDGSTERDYTYIGDIIDGIMKSIDWVCSGQRKYEVLNLGESNTIRLDRMVRALEEALGKQAALTRLPMQPGDVNRTNADISRAKHIIGYDPQWNFEDGIQAFVSWFNG